MLTLNSKFRIGALTLLIGFVTIASNTHIYATTLTAQARAEIAVISNDARDGFQVKNDVLSVLRHAETMARGPDLGQVQALILQVENMGNQEVLGTFSPDFMSAFSQFTAVLNNAQLSKEVSSFKDAGSTSVSPQLLTTVSLRDAVYTPLCGSTRADTTATIIALGVFLVAEAVKEAAISGCGTVVVAAGFGGSPQSAVCSGVVAGVFQIARGVWEEFQVCQESIDNAEILGAYQRAEDVFNAVNEHDTDLKANLATHDAKISSNLGAISDGIALHDIEMKANLAQHDTDIKSDVAQHDADIKARLDEINGKLDTTIELLKTPPGRRPGWNDKP